MCLFTKIFKRWHFSCFVTVVIGNRTSHNPIFFVAILETDKFPCCSDPTLLITWLYDYEPNWTPLSCINIYLHNFFLLLVKKNTGWWLCQNEFPNYRTCWKIIWRCEHKPWSFPSRRENIRSEIFISTSFNVH